MEGTPEPNISCYLHERLILFCSGKTIEETDIGTENGTAVACSKDNYDITGYHKLIIRSASFPRNDGLYKCVARNDVGNASIQFRVNVTGKNVFVKAIVIIMHVFYVIIYNCFVLLSHEHFLKR